MNKRNSQAGTFTRRDALKAAAMGAAGMLVTPKLARAANTAPMIVPSRFFGPYAPSNTINIAQIGFGRIGASHDLPETLRHEGTRFVAAADVDLKRARQAPDWLRTFYARPNINRPGTPVEVQVYQDYREMLERHPEIDAVLVSTPDHAHLLPVLHAAMLGKAIYMQKPHSLTIQEGRMISDVLHRMGTTFSVGSQQRSTRPWPQFKQACELVRNGRVGNLRMITVGLPGDPAGGDATPQPVPATFDYDHWLGTTPRVPYCEDRCHPQNSLSDRGGWLRCEQFSAGMITGWGAHHIDIAHWGMGTEYTGPTQLEATAEFATGGLWNVHGSFRVEAKYANHVTMIVTGDAPNGIKFEGDEGWIFVTRGNAQVTASDPANPNRQPPLTASDPRLLEPLPAGAIRLYGDENTEHHADWLGAVRRRTAITAAPVEVSHRSTSACLISHIAMKLKKPLRWDPIREQFDDRQANSMLARSQRAAYRPTARVPGLANLLGED